MSYTVDDLFFETSFTTQDGMVKVALKLHPLDQPYSEERPVAVLYVPENLLKGSFTSELIEIIRDRVALDLDEIYARGAFKDYPPDTDLQEIRLQLETTQNPAT